MRDLPATPGVALAGRRGWLRFLLVAWVVVLVGAAGLLVVLTWAPQVEEGEFPYLPLAIRPGLTTAALREQVARFRLQVKLDGVNPDGSYKVGIVEAMTEDRRGYVYANVTAGGLVDQVGYKIVGTASAVDGQERMFQQRYLAAGWTKSTPALLRTQYAKASRTVIVTRQFECDGDFPDEQFYLVVESAERPAVSWWKRWFSGLWR